MKIPNFLGLDLRDGERKPGSLVLADHVRITDRGSCVRRPGLRRLHDLPAASAGLYTVDDTLRVVAPNGTSSAGLFPTVLLDQVDTAVTEGRVQAVRMASGRRAIWIEHTGSVGGPAGIHITNRLADTAETGSAVVLPSEFLGAWGLIGLYGRLWSLDPVANRLRWSGVDDPDINDGKGYMAVWAEGEPLDQHGGSVDLGQGSSEALALAEYRGRACVFLRTQVQTWLPGPDGVDSLDQTITGPGTRFAGTVAAVSGDLIYADAGSWVRSLGTDGTTEGAQEGSEVLGTRVHELTKNLILPGGDMPVSLFSRGLSCYLVGSGTTLLCLSLTPGGRVHGWSRWPLPLPGPITGITEARGLVYLRCGTALFYLEPNALNDEVTTGVYQPIAPDVELCPIATTETGANGSMAPTIERLGIVINQTATIQPITDDQPRVASTIVPKAPAPFFRRGAWPAWTFAIRVRSDESLPDWSLDSLIIE